MKIFGQHLAGSALVALFLLLSPIMVVAQDVRFETDRLTIRTADGRQHMFDVELAVTADQRQQGLMDRREMGADRGMLFDFGRTRRVLMWMKNTYLPLDMLFVSEDGTIETIRENAVPMSEAIIDSVAPVAFVLELNAGTVKRLTIAPGDLVDTPRIANPPADRQP